MKIVKITYNFDWPLFRQTPKSTQVWGDYKFVIDDELTECDYWVIYCDYLLKKETLKCPPENIIFIPGECYNTSPKFSQKFLDQFGLILTVQRELKHRNIKYTHNANPWFVDKSYDELVSGRTPEKPKMISVITSNKSFTEGHRKRLAFVKRLKEHFGDQLDLFGRGINDFEDKWEVVAPYKYSIAIENDFCDDWVTEKFFDCIYANTLAFYYGCPNLEDTIDERSFIRIDLNNFDATVRVIENALENKEFEKRAEAMQQQKLRSLDSDQFFPWLTAILDEQNNNAVKKKITLILNEPEMSINERIKSNLRRVKKSRPVKKLKKLVRQLTTKEKKIVRTAEEEIQYQRCLPWFEANGDQTLRLDYDLNEDSVVFDLGGYKGEFAEKIYGRYQSHIYVFEPVASFYKIIEDKFADNIKVKPYQYGLAGKDGTLQISLTADSSSVFIDSKDSETIVLKSITDFITCNEIAKVDLIKINIEGGEYEVLESLLDLGMIERFENIQVQFHDFIISNAADRMKKIQDRLANTHELTYQYEFVWENWKLKK